MLDNITEEELLKNKEEFINLLRSINRDGVEDLINYLDTKSDFFVAPASTKYHGVFKGGLCKHSLVVYDILKKLSVIYTELTGQTIEDDSLKVVALCHDLSKVNTYELTYSNKKVYSPTGSKYDAGGNYDWQAIESYKMIDLNDRFILRQFIGLRMQESAAICLHHGGLDNLSLPPTTVGQNYGRYPLALLLHEADLLATYTIA